MVTVCSHDVRWADRFDKERVRLKAALGDRACRIEHIGSTSVPGLAAKPIIDILVGTDDLEALDACNGVMREAGYEVKGEYGLAGRRYFRRNGKQGQRLVHVHAYGLTDPAFHRHLAFRDYLRSHPGEAARYGAHKLALSRTGGPGGQAYQSAKSEMVAAIEARALTWIARARRGSVPGPT